MTVLPFSDLLTSVSFEGFKSAIFVKATELGLNPTAWRPTDPTRTLISIFATVFAEWSVLLVELHKMGFLSYAEGSRLTVLASEVYGVERIAATFAAGEVTLTSTAAVNYTIAIGDLTVQSSTSGKTYRNQDGGTLLAGGTLTLSVLATEAGADSSALATEVDTVASTLLGVTVSNADALVGTDEETDAALTLRCLDSLSAVSPDGARRAYAYAATTAVDSDGASYGITRVKEVATDGAVTVYLATASGAPTAPTITAVDTIIQSTTVPLGVTCTTTGATEVGSGVTATLYASDATATSDAEIIAAGEAAMVALFAQTPIGGYSAGATSNVLFQTEIAAKLSEASGDVFRAVVTVPASDLVLGVTGVPVLGAVALTVERVEL